MLFLNETAIVVRQFHLVPMQMTFLLNKWTLESNPKAVFIHLKNMKT